MSFNRIWAICLRYLYFFAQFETLAELLFWPLIDVLLWGLTGVWVQKGSDSVPELALAILTALVFWQILWRTSYEITVNLLREYWERNLVNLFSTPLKVSEWMSAVLITGLGKTLFNIGFSSLIIFLFYKLNVFTIQWAFLPYAALLCVAGWSIGFVTAGILALYGQRMQMLAWMTPFAVAPFSAIFYPLATLPAWAQKIALCLPTTYIFEGMRSVLFEGTFSMYSIWMSLILNAIYLVASILFFKMMFEKSRTKGLARLE